MWSMCCAERAKSATCGLPANRSRWERRTIDGYVAQRESVDVLGDRGGGDIGEGAVGQRDRADAVVGIADQIPGLPGLAHGQLRHVDAADGRVEAVAGSVFVEEVDEDRDLGDLPDLDLSHVDVLDEAAA